MLFLNQPFIPTQSIMLIQHQTRIIHILLQYPFIMCLILQDLHQRNQHFIPFFFTLLHKWMLLITLHPVTLTFSNSYTPNVLTTLFAKHL